MPIIKDIPITIIVNRIVSSLVGHVTFFSSSITPLPNCVLKTGFAILAHCSIKFSL